MWVLSLGQEDSLEEEMATHSSIFAWKISWAEDPKGYIWGHKKSDMTEHTAYSIQHIIWTTLLGFQKPKSEIELLSGEDFEEEN